MILTNFWYFSYNYAENFHFLENQPLQDDGIIFAENRTHFCAIFQKKKKKKIEGGPGCAPALLTSKAAMNV